jgi:5-methylcytosine-specific restriction endonuclease McrA
VLVTRSSFRREIIDAWDGICAYCGCQPKNITLDHVIAKARGGPTVRANQVAACARCNASKGDSDVWDWYHAQPFHSTAREEQIRSWLMAETVESRKKQQQ